MLYKLRAECLQDIVKFINKIDYQLLSFNMKKDSEYPDVEFEFETNLTIEEIILALREIQDLHVMYQTVKRLPDYTGERDYSCDIISHNSDITMSGKCSNCGGVDCN